LEKEELDLLLDTIADDGSLIAARDRFMIALMAIEGPRTVELHRVNIGDTVRRGNGVGIQVQAKRSRRVVPLTVLLAVRLEQYLELRRKLTGQELDASEPLFISLDRATSGQRLSRRGIRKRVDHYLTLANLKHAPGRTLPPIVCAIPLVPLGFVQVQRFAKSKISSATRTPKPQPSTSISMTVGKPIQDLASMPKFDAFVANYWQLCLILV
jgi:hypothetical protein